MNYQEQLKDRFLGCLIGGAAGDALGYEVEFMTERAIRIYYGVDGIRRYALSDGRAIVSDDTQMTLYTANGLLCGAAAGCEEAEYIEYIGKCYQDWLLTQQMCNGQGHQGKVSWLNSVPELNYRRAPGNTCMSALMSGEFGTLADPINGSKGCGGVMRTAPVGLLFEDEGKCARLGAVAAAITHGHDLGYLPAAMLSAMVCTLVNRPEISVKEAALSAMETLKKEFSGVCGLNTMLSIAERAIHLAEMNMEDVSAIHLLGEGWVGEEALAIAVYCALKYENDFEGCLVAAVNHRGDSDSTGAIAGNILGAKLGLTGIPQCYLTHLELRSVMEEIASDLLEARKELAGGNVAYDWKEKYLPR